MLWGKPKWTLGTSLILLNSVYRGDRRGSRGALDLQGACFLFRNGIWSGVDVWPGTLSGEILPPCAVLPMADVGSGGWFHAPSVGSARMNTGCQFSFGDESPGNKEFGEGPDGRASIPGYGAESDVGSWINHPEGPPLMNQHGKTATATQ